MKEFSSNVVVRPFIPEKGCNDYVFLIEIEGES